MVADTQAIERRSFSWRLRAYKDRSGRTWRSIADAIGCSESMLHKWDRGEHLPNAIYTLAIVNLAAGDGLPEMWVEGLDGDGAANPATLAARRRDGVITGTNGRNFANQFVQERMRLLEAERVEETDE